MDLHTLREKIIESSPEEWNKITCWGDAAGPVYRYSLTSERGESDIQTEAKGHSNTAVLIADIDISIAWGWDPDESLWGPRGGRDFDFSDFLPIFPDDDVSRMYTDVFYRGALVDRVLFVVADGGRHYVPIPRTTYPDKPGYTAAEYGEPEHHYTRWQIGLATVVNGFEQAAPLKEILDRMTYVLDN
ncbi:hypothetical protein [Mycobacterium sp. 360MFTsu5.1]|uniref:hypothetical protein n=1 Tax=Mycobacterium sp. 360MFTsu5.1 TaxID=1172186 RepID=UPI00037BE1E1|nr:hypothetical protein [Mycobacterium sp. 360MFTsu5.1]